MSGVPKGGKPTGAFEVGPERSHHHLGNTREPTGTVPASWAAIQQGPVVTRLGCEQRCAVPVDNINSREYQIRGDYGDLIQKPPSVTPEIPCPWGE